MPYRPISADDRAVPHLLQQQTHQIRDLQSLTSGQINSTLAELKRTVDALPVFRTGVFSSFKWPGKPSGSSTAITLLSGSVPVPEGKTQMSGFVFTSGLWIGPKFAPDSVSVDIGGYRPDGAPVSFSQGSAIWGTGFAVNLPEVSGQIPVKVLMITEGDAGIQKCYLHYKFDFTS